MLYYFKLCNKLDSIKVPYYNLLMQLLSHPYKDRLEIYYYKILNSHPLLYWIMRKYQLHYYINQWPSYNHHLEMLNCLLPEFQVLQIPSIFMEWLLLDALGALILFIIIYIKNFQNHECNHHLRKNPIKNQVQQIRNFLIVFM